MIRKFISLYAYENNRFSEKKNIFTDMIQKSYVMKSKLRFRNYVGEINSSFFFLFGEVDLKI